MWVTAMEPASAQAKDAFLSYSRLDAEFVSKLIAALKGIEVWVDVEGIYASESVWPVIDSAIDGAGVFVVVVSRNSAESAGCLREIERARQGNKRMVPIVIDQVDRDKLPPAIQERHWISFTSGFGDSLDKLREVIRRDPAWLRGHADLLVRSRRWDAADRGDYLLQGRELSDALLLVADAAGKDPALGPLQIEFMQASQRAAEVQREEARRKHAISVSLHLLAEAEALAQRAASNLPRAILLALESHRRSPSSGAERLLLQGLLLCRQAAAFEARQRVAVSDNGRFVAMAEGRQLRVIEFPSLSSLDFPEQREAIEFLSLSADGSHLAVWGNEARSSHLLEQSGRVRVWRVQDRQEVGRVHFPGKVETIVFSGNGLIAVGGIHHSVMILNIGTGQQTWLKHDDSVVFPVAFGAGEEYLATCPAGGRSTLSKHRVWIWRGPQWKLGPKIDVPFEIDCLTFNPAGTYLLMCTRAAILIYAVSKRFGRIRCRLMDSSSIPKHILDLRFDPCLYMPRFVTAGEDGSLRLWALGSGTFSEHCRYTHDAAVTSIALRPAGTDQHGPIPFDSMASASKDCTVREWAAGETGRAVHPGPVAWVRYTSDGKYFVSATEDGSVYLWESNGKGLGAASGLSLEEIISLVRTRVGREISAEELPLPDDPESAGPGL